MSKPTTAANNSTSELEKWLERHPGIGLVESLAQAIQKDLEAINKRLEAVEQYQRTVQNGPVEVLRQHSKPLPTDVGRLDVNPRSHTYQRNQ